MAIPKKHDEFLEKKMLENPTEENLPEIIGNFLKLVVHEENRHFIKKMLIYMFPECDFFEPNEYYSRSRGWDELKKKIKNEPNFMQEMDDYLFARSLFGE